MRNQAALKAFIQGAASPTQPSTYRQFLTPEQYTSTYGPLPADYQKLVDWAKAAGFTVTTYGNNMLVSVQGTVATVEKALFLNLNYYSRPDGTQFYAPDREPSLNLAPPVLRVSGLDNLYVPKPNVNRGDPHLFGVGDLHDTYASCHPELLGAGQTVAVVSYAAYNPADLQHYEDRIHGVPFGTVSMVSVDGASTLPDWGAGMDEANLDVQMVVGMAPSANIIMYVMKSNVASTNDALALIATTKPLALQVSDSWGLYNDSTTQQVIDQLAAQGQSFFSMSGDEGADDVDVDHAYWSINMDNITLVGGTNPILNSTQTAIDHEEAWSGSSGGVLKTVALPYYQVGVSGLGSNTRRSYPDVAAYATNVEYFSYNPSLPIGGSGTSVSTPLWAGFIALANSASANPVGLGFINPAIYYIAQSPDYGDTFNDVTAGSTPSTIPGGPTYSAATGYDLTTGWGSPKCGLIDKLTTPCAPSDTDPHNCGTCWHDCQGGACVGGVCQPLALTGPQMHVGGPVVDAAFIYWTSDNTVNKAPINGGATSVFTTSEGAAQLIAINRESVFWYDAVKGTLRRQLFVDNAPTTIVSALNVEALAANEDQIYWVDWLHKQIDTVVLKDNTKTTLVNTSGYPRNIKIDATNVYWTEFVPGTSIAIMKMRLAGGTPVQLASVPEEWASPISLSIDIDATNVYWVDDTGSLRKVPIAGGAATVLATFPTSTPLESLAVSGAVYVVTRDINGGAIVKVPLGGGSPVTMVSDPNLANEVAARGSAIYYNTDGNNAPGPIMKLAK